MKNKVKNDTMQIIIMAAALRIGWPEVYELTVWFGAVELSDVKYLFMISSVVSPTILTG
jgi:spore maturation protein SpmB